MILTNNELKYVLKESINMLLNERYDTFDRNRNENPYYNGNDYAFGNDQFFDLEKMIPKICHDNGWRYMALVGPSGNPGAPFEVVHGYLIRPDYNEEIRNKEDAEEYLRYNLGKNNNVYIGDFNAGWTADTKEGEYWGDIEPNDIYVSISDNNKAQEFNRLSDDYKKRNRNLY